MGFEVRLTLDGKPDSLPPDAPQAWQAAQAAGLRFDEPPEGWRGEAVAIDALLGIGANRAPEGALAQRIQQLRQWPHEVLAVDIPSGLCADTGQPLGKAAVRADHTLSLLTLKPGLFTAEGRDHAGQVWFSPLGCGEELERLQLSAPWPVARLYGPHPPRALNRRSLSLHRAHKGQFGDTAVIGGAPSMQGAAWLAAMAALHAGAGRVWCSLFERETAAHAGAPPQATGQAPEPPSASAASHALERQPELMIKPWREALAPDFLSSRTVVCGCGGGQEVSAALPALLRHAARLVIDADGLNALASEPKLLHALRARPAQSTVLTPHPLEAARLLDTDSASVQSNRLQAARELARKTGAVVVLKGSGTVVATPTSLDPKDWPTLNASGHAALATPGSGDVLAGWLGGLWSAAAHSGASATLVAREAVLLHGRAAESAERWPLCASDLIVEMHRLASAD
jgi:hydroxyethylthiazole kinase-like uncharacterized protein yjeF